MPKRGVQVNVKHGKGLKVVVERANPKPGQGRTLGEFSNHDGKAMEAAEEYINRNGHTKKTTKP